MEEGRGKGKWEGRDRAWDGEGKGGRGGTGRRGATLQPQNFNSWRRHWIWLLEDSISTHRQFHGDSIFVPRPYWAGALSDDAIWRLSVWRLSFLSRTSDREQRPRKTKIGTWPTSHVTRTPLSWSKGQRSRSPGRFIHRVVNASGSCSGERGNVLAVVT